MTKIIPVNAEVTKMASTPLLDEVSEAYNHYRLGLMEASLDFDDSFLQQTSFSDNIQKEAQLDVASNDISKLLLGTSYWNSMSSNFSFLEER